MEQNNQVNGKNPIVNGSVNPSLTVEEMVQFDIDTKRQMLWTLKVGSEFAHHYQEIDPSVFEPLNYKLTYSEIEKMSDAELDDNLSVLVACIEHHALKMKAATWEHLYAIGEEFREANKRFGLRGDFNMPLAQVAGYLAAYGVWNDFDPSKVIPTLQELDKTFPRVDYGLNNPNTGRRQHEWFVSSDTIKIKVDYCSPEMLKKIETWFKSVENTIRVKAIADEVNIYTKDFCFNDNAPTAHEVTIRLWWD